MNILDTEDTFEILQKISKISSNLHHSFNIYNFESEISILNTNKQIKPSTAFKDLLLIAIKYELLTDHYFNTNQTFAEKNNITFNQDMVHIKDPIDLGGIAKGYLMLLIKNYLDPLGVEYEINFGGSLLYEQDKVITIRDVNSPQEEAIEVAVDGRNSIHTSSYYWQHDGVNSHIYQRNCGYKVIHKSISVIDSNPILADALSTALYSMELYTAIEYIKKYKLKVVYQFNDMIYISNTIKQFNCLIADKHIQLIEV